MSALAAAFHSPSKNLRQHFRNKRTAGSAPLAAKTDGDKRLRSERPGSPFPGCAVNHLRPRLLLNSLEQHGTVPTPAAPGGWQRGGSRRALASSFGALAEPIPAESRSRAGSEGLGPGPGPAAGFVPPGGARLPPPTAGSRRQDPKR